ncbi:hypothetical protein BDR07DRAFT_341863 [Suillus spraguei]|nr:hypothetical protein BDR07DRAFT_341863 [Suillus spraguei]
MDIPDLEGRCLRMRMLMRISRALESVWRRLTGFLFELSSSFWRICGGAFMAIHIISQIALPNSRVLNGKSLARHMRMSFELRSRGMKGVRPSNHQLGLRLVLFNVFR